MRALTGKIIATLPLLLVVMGIAAPPASAADHAGQINVGGIVRSYEFHVPDRPSPSSGFPLILAFHGGGGQARGMSRLTGFNRLADEHGFVVVYPNGLDRHWNDGRSTIKQPVDDVGFVSALLDRIGQEVPVDQARIFATGISNGALFAERLGCDLSQRIRAIAPVAGTLPADLSPRCRPARSVAVLQIDGTDDPIMPYDGGAVADFGGRGEGGIVLSVGKTIMFWARANGCAGAAAPIEYRPVALLDRTRVIETRHQGCTPGAPVVLFSIEGGGHAWPGGPQYLPAALIGRASRQLDASQVIGDFFLSLPPRR